MVKNCDRKVSFATKHRRFRASLVDPMQGGFLTRSIKPKWKAILARLKDDIKRLGTLLDHHPPFFWPNGSFTLTTTVVGNLRLHSPGDLEFWKWNSCRRMPLMVNQSKPDSQTTVLEILILERPIAFYFAVEFSRCFGPGQLMVERFNSQADVDCLDRAS
jgi:hypothetical protein